MPCCAAGPRGPCLRCDDLPSSQCLFPLSFPSTTLLSHNSLTWPSWTPSPSFSTAWTLNSKVFFGHLHLMKFPIMHAIKRSNQPFFNVIALKSDIYRKGQGFGKASAFDMIWALNCAGFFWHPHASKFSYQDQCSSYKIQPVEWTICQSYYNQWPWINGIMGEGVNFWESDHYCGPIRAFNCEGFGCVQHQKFTS